MFLNKKYKDISVKNKIFIVSTFVIIVGFIILYLGIYIVMPQAYKTYKCNLLKNNVDELVEDLSHNSFDVYTLSVIDRFSYENGIAIQIVDEDGRLIYTSRRENINNGGPQEFKRDFHIDKHNNFYYEKYFTFNNSDESYLITVNAMIPVLYETKNLLKVFFPIVIAAIVVIAVTISFFYSIIISKPLIEINRKAKKMSNLDFSERFYPKGRDEIGELSNSLNILCDNLYENISMLEDANAKLRNDIDKEREAQKERKEFIATISHELKSPITIIAGQLEGMIYNIGKYKDRDKYLKETYGVTKEMEKLVMEILELSRSDKDNFTLELRKIDISKMIKDILRDNYYFIESKGLNLNEDIEEGVIKLGDSRLLRKAFINIIRNAIQHSPEGKDITVFLSENELIVENTGVTIEKKEIQNIFNAFYRVDKSRNSNTGGTGLGLYIVKSIFDKHDNIKYGIESKEDKVAFKVRFM